MYVLLGLVLLLVAGLFGDFEVGVIVGIMSVSNVAMAYMRLHILDQSLYNAEGAAQASKAQYILGALGLAICTWHILM